MKYKILLFTVLFLFPLYLLQAQTIYYGYDLNGNRTSRNIIVSQLKSTSAVFGTEEEKKSVKEDEEIENKISIKIYPNPTRGIIRVEIKNLQDGDLVNLKLFDLGGLQLISQVQTSQVFDLDISNYTDATYILVISVNKFVSNWKIIKNGS